MNRECFSLKQTLFEIENDWGGDISFIQTMSEADINNLETKINWRLPGIFRYFYTKESNGLIIDDKRIYSIYDDSEKKTWVENIFRMNNPDTSPWFKYKPRVLDDYLVIGNDNDSIFCLCKRYDYDNPFIYICKNPKSNKEIYLDLLKLDLEGLIKMMVKNAFVK